MRILIVAATEFEVAELISTLGQKTEHADLYHINSVFHQINLLITGVGLIFTTFKLTKQLSNCDYDLVVNVGICGAFNPDFQIGDVVEIKSDCFADIGIDDNGNFKTIFELGFADPAKYPFVNGLLLSNSSFQTNLKSASAITTAQTHGSIERIDKIKQKFPVDTESMEGAACFFVAQNFNIQCLQLRAVSNYVEPRQVKNWNIPLTLMNLNRIVNSLLINNLII